MIYNKLRVGFQERGQAKSDDTVIILPSGDLNQNPGRVLATDPRFNRTRRSIVAQFTFKGEPVYVIGNHFNSKGGDSSMWGANQPPVFRSEHKRIGMADGINDFCELILKHRPNANIVVLGDFNDYGQSLMIKALEDNDLKNLMTHSTPEGIPLVAPEDRYTYNYSGNSQPLDYILVSESLQNREPEMDILHINTDYMFQVSDHDPIIARFKF